MDTKHFKENTNLSKIDFENGEILEVSLITTGEILGHNMHLNEAGLDSFLECVEGSQVKAYYKHSDENEALSSIGYFENFKKVDAGEDEYKLVGDFSALNAWKESNEKEYKTFFELATKAPEVFGISVEALIASKYYDDEDKLVDASENTPNDETIIYAFCEKVLAWSVVSTPATNPNGLFSVNVEEENTEDDQELVKENLKQKENMEQVKELENKIETLEKEKITLMELSKELQVINTSLIEENDDLSKQIKDLESKVESFELGSEVLEHSFTEEVDLATQIEGIKDWGIKSKLVMSNLNNLEIKRN
jgi:hypothetical protein